MLNILSAGAAQAVVEELREQFRRDRAITVNAQYGGVGSINARVLAAEPVDVVILTSELIDGLIAQGLVMPGSRQDLGQVGTALAVRADSPRPKVDTVAALRNNLLAATRIICPDPSIATAGKVFLDALAAMGIAEQVRGRLEYTQSGSAAMTALAQGTTPLEIGVVQATEIRAGKDIVMAGPLPAQLQRCVTYSMGLASAARNPGCARDFMESLAGVNGRPILRAAGFDIDSGMTAEARTPGPRTEANNI